MEPEHQWNRYILTGYRINYTSWPLIIKSLFEWHNETMNIWTHLLGFCAYGLLLLVIAFSQVGEDVVPDATVGNFLTNSVDSASDMLT